MPMFAVAEVAAMMAPIEPESSIPNVMVSSSGRRYYSPGL
jgi:hypothetical protein